MTVTDSGQVQFISSSDFHFVSVHKNVFVDVLDKSASEQTSSDVEDDTLFLENFSERHDNSSEHSSPSPPPSTTGLAWGDCSRYKQKREIEIAVASDSTFCAQYGSNANRAKQKLQALLKTAEKAYRTVSCLRFKISFLEVNCNPNTDPYRYGTGMTGSPRVRAFREQWLSTAKYASVQRDIAVLVTGGHVGATTGAAFVASVCTTAAYTWVSGSALRGDSFVVKTLAHEVGHNLGMLHYSSGIMMQGGNPSAFDPSSTIALLAFLRTTSTHCITPVDYLADHHNPIKPPVVYKCVKNGAQQQVSNDCLPSGKHAVAPVVARIGRLKIGGTSVQVRVYRKVEYGKIELVLRAPGERNIPGIGVTTFDLSLTIAIGGFRKARSIFIPKYVLGAEHRLVFEEASLATERKWQVCCGREKLTVVIQTLLRANVQGRLVARQHIIKALPINLTCRTCRGKGNRYVLPMASNRRCAVCVQGRSNDTVGRDEEDEGHVQDDGEDHKSGHEKAKSGVMLAYQ